MKTSVNMPRACQHWRADPEILRVCFCHLYWKCSKLQLVSILLSHLLLHGAVEEAPWLKLKTKKGTLKFNGADKDEQCWHKLQKWKESDIKVHFCFCGKPQENWICCYSFPRMAKIPIQLWLLLQNHRVLWISKFYFLTFPLLLLANHFTVNNKERTLKENISYRLVRLTAALFSF